MSQLESYLLNNHNVRRLVPARTIGFYRLGNERSGRFQTSYFGRSDVDLRQRLLQHAKGRRDTRFQAVTTSTIYEGFALECSEWHLNVPGVRNVLHPDAPRGIAYGCPWCTLRSDPAMIATSRALGAFL